MATEEQTFYNVSMGMSGDVGDESRGAQLLTITNRKVTKLSFPVTKINSPTGDVTMTIRLVSDDSILNSKVWGDASTIPAFPTVTWIKATFTTPVIINASVRICLEFSGGDAGTNQVALYYQSTDVKASENRSRYVNGTGWVGASSDDQAYIYTHEKGGGAGGGIFPVDDVARVSSIRHIVRPGFFRMQVGLGDLGFDIDIAEATVRKELDTSKEPEQIPPAPSTQRPVISPDIEPGTVPDPTVPAAPAPTPLPQFPLPTDTLEKVMERIRLSREHTRLRKIWIKSGSAEDKAAMDAALKRWQAAPR